MDRRRWGRMDPELGEGMVVEVGLGKWMNCVGGFENIEYVGWGLSWGVERQGVMVPAPGPFIR